MNGDRMDRIERSMEHLLGVQARHDERIAGTEEMASRAWRAIEALADKQGKLDDALGSLAGAIERVAGIDAERGRRLDERIDKLVSAIGELARGR